MQSKLKENVDNKSTKTSVRISDAYTPSANPPKKSHVIQKGTKK